MASASIAERNIVFPLKSVVLKNERTGEGQTFSSQLGEPMKIVSKSSIFASPCRNGDNTPQRVRTSLLPCCMKKEYGSWVQASCNSPSVMSAMSSASFSMPGPSSTQSKFMQGFLSVGWCNVVPTHYIAGILSWLRASVVCIDYTMKPAEQGLCLLLYQSRGLESMARAGILWSMPQMRLSRWNQAQYWDDEISKRCRIFLEFWWLPLHARS